MKVKDQYYNQQNIQLYNEEFSPNAFTKLNVNKKVILQIEKNISRGIHIRITGKVSPENISFPCWVERLWFPCYLTEEPVFCEHFIIIKVWKYSTGSLSFRQQHCNHFHTTRVVNIDKAAKCCSFPLLIKTGHFKSYHHLHHYHFNRPHYNFSRQNRMCQYYH